MKSFLDVTALFHINGKYMEIQILGELGLSKERLKIYKYNERILKMTFSKSFFDQWPRKIFNLMNQ